MKLTNEISSALEKNSVTKANGLPEISRRNKALYYFRDPETMCTYLLIAKKANKLSAIKCEYGGRPEVCEIDRSEIEKDRIVQLPFAASNVERMMDMIRLGVPF